MNYSTEKVNELETYHIYQHEDFVIRWSDLDNFANVYRVDREKDLFKWLVKDLIHNFVIPKEIAGKNLLQKSLEVEIKTYKKAMKCN
jgi:hypothetical protein